MERFSDRIGVTKQKNVLQTDSIDKELQVKIWNFIYAIFLNKFNRRFINDTDPSILGLAGNIWGNFFFEKADEFPFASSEYIAFIKYRYFNLQWFEIYNFLEFVLQNYTRVYQVKDGNSNLMNDCNIFLMQELSGFRFIQGRFLPISNDNEIEAVNKVFTVSDKFSPVKAHMAQAISLLSDKTNPDYRNSMKESISAVESMAALITGDDKATLGQALKVIETKHELHPALKNAFSSLYGYTSDADGIRHKLLEEDKLKQEDAIYMLVTCSAFINYLTVKSNTQ